MAGAAAANVVPSFGRAAPSVSLTDLGPDLIAIAGAGASVVARRGSDGWLLVDGE
jgi:hypothetical protein